MAEIALRHKADALKRTPTVLVAEDEFMIRVLLSDYLQECGFKVLVANDATQAIAIIESSDVEIDVVFANISLPGPANGFGLATWILENRPDLRVLFGSGDHQKSELAKELCESGPLMRKPYDLAAIVRRIRAILGEMNL
jgi:DNA-binding response OmpR family regulator